MKTEITAPISFSDAPDFEYTCPKCNVGVLVPDQTTFKKIEPKHSEAAHGHPDWDPDWITFRFSVFCVCNKKDCGEVAIVSGNGGVDQRFGCDGQPELYELFTIKSFFPAPRFCYVPSETPRKVVQQLDRSFALYWVEVSAAANALRASLEALLGALRVPASEKKQNGNTVRMTLHRRLEAWSDTNKDHAQLCHALKEVGNLGSHGEVVKAKHYFASLEIFSHVLKELFDNDSQKMKELAKSIQDDIKKIKPPL